METRAQKRKTRSGRVYGESGNKKQTPRILVSSTAAVECSAAPESIHTPGRLANFPKQDPLSVLNDEVCLEIFSFLCPTPETESNTHLTTLEWLQSKAGKLHSQLRSVSNAWRKMFDAIDWKDWVGLVRIDFCAENAHIGNSMIDWLCANKIQLGRVDALWVGLGDLPLLAKLIEECPTEKLEVLKVTINFTHRKQGSRSLFWLPCRPITVTAGKRFQDTVAQNCPNLEALGLTVMLPKTTPIYTAHINQTVFSSPLIKELYLDVKFFYDKKAVVDPKWGTSTPINGRMYTKLIQNLPNLKQLHLRSSKTVLKLLKNRRFEVESPTLEKLDIGGLSVGIVLSVACPALKRIILDGGPNGNSCLVNQVTPQVYQQIFTPPFLTFGPEGNSPMKSTVNRMGSANLQAPQGCRLLLKNFHQWGEGGKTYADYTKHVNDFPNPIFRTFHEG